MPRSVSLILLTALMTTTIVIGCVNVQVQTDYDEQAAFSSLRTFSWAPDTGKKIDDPRIDNTLLDGRIRRAVERELEASGYQEISEGEPDFLVTYHASLRTKLDTTATGMGYRGYYGYGAWGGYVANWPTEYEEGTLIVDVINPKANLLMWRGTGQSRVHRGDATPEERTERMNEVVAAILKDFPPK